LAFSDIAGAFIQSEAMRCRIIAEVPGGSEVHFEATAAASTICREDNEGEFTLTGLLMQRAWLHLKGLQREKQILHKK
jgi:hypothetical protein